MNGLAGDNFWLVHKPGNQPLAIDAWRAVAGHDIEVVGAFDPIMGHAGALVHYPDGLIEGACDPRSDGVTLFKYRAVERTT